MSLNAMKNWRIRLAGDAAEYRCQPDQTVLDALIAVQNRVIAAGCRSGGCGVCKVQVLEGSYRCGKMSKTHVSDEELTEGFTLACKTYPQSDLLVKPCQSTPGSWAERFAVSDKACKAE